ncbi:MAG TPA: tetratricopeptide repeat protein, partial [Gemmatimonadaceae bacterium]|nr:tetratricopeptide repeat protein [Gemmatimonadaceae bacterium]
GAGVLLLIGLPIMLFTARRERERIMARTTGSSEATAHGLAGRLFTWRGALTGGGLALGGLALGTAAFMGLRAAGVGPFATLVSAGVLSARDPLVLADFNNRTSDSTLGASITEALRIDLTQSPVVRLVEGNEVTATLRRMERDPADGVTEALAREVAQRSGAKAVLAGDIVPLGSGYVLTARLVSATDSSTLLGARETAADAAGLIAAVERLSRTLREEIGESLRTIRAGHALEQVTTSSLAALRAYSEGHRLNDQNQGADALRYLNQAVALDSNFGMAWRQMGVILSNLGLDRPRMREALTRAYALRSRMPPREAAHAQAFYFSTVEGDFPKAIAAYEQLLASWPDDLIATNNAAIYHFYLGRNPDAERLLRHARTLRPNAAIYSGNLVEVLVRQGKFEAADTVLRDWAVRSPTNASRFFFTSAVFREQGDLPRAYALADSLGTAEGEGAAEFGIFTKAELFRLEGRFAEAERQGRILMQAAERAGLVEWYFDVARNNALAQALILQQPDAAVRSMDAALARHPIDSLPPGRRPYGDVATVMIAAGRVDRARALLAEQERMVPAELREGDARAHYARAQLALTRSDGRAALDELRRAATGQRCVMCTAFDEGRAFELLAQTDSAILQYERYANGHAVELEGRDFLLPAALRRLGELYESRGERAKALEYYGRFVDLWKNADPALQPLVRDIRRQMAQLTGDPPR